MKYMLFCITTISLFLSAIKSEFLIFNYILISFLIYLLLKENIVIFTIKRFWYKKKTLKLGYSLHTKYLVSFSFTTGTAVPKFNFYYTVDNKAYEGFFTYDVRFFNAEKDTITFCEEVKQIDFFYNPNNPKRYFVIKPKNGVMVREKYYLLFLFAMAIVSLIYNIGKLYIA